jgi:stress-induced morphogen
MATVTRGKTDEYVERMKAALDAYEVAHRDAVASLYRQNSGSIRIRVVADHFGPMSRGARHDEVWDFLAGQLSEDDMEEISVLLLLSPKEQAKSFMNTEFDDPTPSRI